jgi:hypothetical protein
MGGLAEGDRKEGDFILRGLVTELAARGLKADYRSVWNFVRRPTARAHWCGTAAGGPERPQLCMQRAIARRYGDELACRSAPVAVIWALQARAARSFTLQVVEQAPRRSEVDGVKSFCESVIDRTQCVARLADPTIAVAQARQARRRAQFP